MNRLKRFLFVPLMCVVGSVSAQLTTDGTWIEPSDENIQYVGRVNFQNPGAPFKSMPDLKVLP